LDSHKIKKGADCCVFLGVPDLVECRYCKQHSRSRKELQGYGSKLRHKRKAYKQKVKPQMGLSKKIFETGEVGKMDNTKEPPQSAGLNWKAFVGSTAELSSQG